MNIDFIKWMCDKADGFVLGSIFLNGIKHDSVKLLVNTAIHHVPLSGIEKAITYPLLKQRAIEGVNRTGKLKVSQNHLAIEVYMTGCAFNVEAFEIVDSITADQAKESALRYIYEQESK